MPKQTTAVELISDKLLEILGDKVNEFSVEQTLSIHYCFKEAKDLERHQIIDAYLDGTAQFDNSAPIIYPKTPQDYYTERFSK